MGWRAFRPLAGLILFGLVFVELKIEEYSRKYPAETIVASYSIAGVIVVLLLYVIFFNNIQNFFKKRNNKGPGISEEEKQNREEQRKLKRLDRIRNAKNRLK